jgi:hypothetical protein
MNRQIVAQSIIDKFNFKTYLEIGVQRGKNFFSVKADRRIAVDPNFKFGIKRRLKNLPSIFKDHFFEMTSDDFFSGHASKVFSKQKLDVALIDGLHTYEQVMKDFKNSLQYLSPDGVILFHDCNPQSPEAAEHAYSPEEIVAKFPGKSPEWNGDVWKAIVHIQSYFKDVEIFVLDCDYGLGFARRGTPSGTSIKLNEKEIAALTYSDLEKNREKFLNLKPESFWNEYVKTL